ncbi:MAG: hypothetical protein MUO28_01245, partial [Desulfobacterales bacterium]|nr:hypothetical protein [Desulfobacterales bacterium]
MTEPNPIPSSEEILKFLQAFPLNLQKVYPRSFCSMNGLLYGMIRTGQGKKLIVIGEKELLFKDPLIGKIFHRAPSLKVCNLSPENTLSLMELFPFTRPVS